MVSDNIKEKKKTLLICRFDGIGDYIIMRRFFKSIRNSKKYKDYKIIFAGRNEFSAFSEKYDKEYIDEFIWIPYASFMAEQEVRKKYLQMFEKMEVDEVISPVYDREVYVCEKVIDQFKDSFVYGQKGPLNRLKKCLSDEGIERYNKNYSKFIDIGENVLSEEERYKRFFEQILDEECTPDKSDFEPEINFKSDFALVGPFSGDPIRTWNEENYIKIINYITEELGYTVGILGGNSDIEKAESIKENVYNKEKVVNLAGKIEISELPLYFNYAKFLLTNETGTIHIAKSTNTKTYCISNGSYMGRFQPYKDSNIKYIYPDNIEQYLEEHQEYGLVSSCDINQITPEKVIKTLNGETIKDKLDIVLVTYNRLTYLKNTLEQLFDSKSPIKDFDITILDNASTDGSSELIQEYAKNHKNIKHIRHNRNISGNANIARAFEHGKKEYIWVICDDDYFHWEFWDEVENAIREQHNAIIVDNEDILDKNDIADIIFQLSFLPSGIYKTSTFTDEVFRNIYDNISNWYPHLAVGINIANTSKDFFVIENSCVINGAAENKRKGIKAADASLLRGLEKTRVFPKQQALCWGAAYTNSLTLLNDEYDITHFINQALKHPPEGVGHNYYTFCEYIVKASNKNAKSENIFYDVFCRVNWKIKLILIYLKYFKNIYCFFKAFQIKYL